MQDFWLRFIPDWKIIFLRVRVASFERLRCTSPSSPLRLQISARLPTEQTYCTWTCGLAHHVVWPEGVGPDTTLAWAGWKQPDIPMEVDTYRLETSRTEAVVLKKLSLAGIAKLSRLKYSWLRLVWPQPTFVDSELTIGWCTQLIPQSSMKNLGLARSA